MYSRMLALACVLLGPLLANDRKFAVSLPLGEDSGGSVDELVEQALAASKGNAQTDNTAAQLFGRVAAMEPEVPHHFSNLGTALMNLANNMAKRDEAVQMYVHAEASYRRAVRLYKRRQGGGAQKVNMLSPTARKNIQSIKGNVKSLRKNCVLRFDDRCKNLKEASAVFRQYTQLADTGDLAHIARLLGSPSPKQPSGFSLPVGKVDPPKSLYEQKQFLKQQYGTGKGVLSLEEDDKVASVSDPMSLVAWNFRNDDFEISNAWPFLASESGIAENEAKGLHFRETKRALTSLKRVMLDAGFYQENVMLVLQEDHYAGYSPERTSSQGSNSEGVAARNALLERISQFEEESHSQKDLAERKRRTMLAYLIRLFYAGLTVDAQPLRKAIGDEAMSLLFLEGGGLGILERQPMKRIHRVAQHARKKPRRNIENTKKRKGAPGRKKRNRNGRRVSAQANNMEKKPYAISSRVQVTPIREDLHVMTDWHETQSRASLEPVMYIGADSRGLVWAQPPIHTAQVLDLCTGSGVQGIVAARYYADRVVFVDFNPRAVRFARMNLVFNGLEDKGVVLLGDLYKALEANLPPENWGTKTWGKFGAVLANPPFLPVAEDDIGQNAYGDGGPDGERVFRRIVEEAPLHLTKQGRVHITSNLLDPHIFDKKLWRWWTKHLYDKWTVNEHTGHRERYMRAPSGKVAAFHLIRGETWKQEHYGDVVGDRRMGDDLKTAGIEYIAKGFIFIYANREPELSVQHSSYTVHNDHESLWSVISTNNSYAHSLLEKYHNLDGHFDGETYPFAQHYPYSYYEGRVKLGEKAEYAAIQTKFGL